MASRSTETRRYRVYFKGTFAGVILADSQADAEAAAPGLLSVRLDRSQ